SATTSRRSADRPKRTTHSSMRSACPSPTAPVRAASSSTRPAPTRVRRAARSPSSSSRRRSGALEVRAIVERDEIRPAVRAGADRADAGEAELHPQRGALVDAERPDHPRLDRRHVADRDDPFAAVGLKPIAAEGLDPRRDVDEALAARWRERRIGEPQLAARRAHLAEWLAVPLAVVELEEAVVDLHARAGYLGDRRRGLLGAAEGARVDTRNRVRCESLREARDLLAAAFGELEVDTALEPAFA